VVGFCFQRGGWVSGAGAAAAAETAARRKKTHNPPADDDTNSTGLRGLLLDDRELLLDVGRELLGVAGVGVAVLHLGVSRVVVGGGLCVFTEAGVFF
jgi:hypothetical protein